MSEEKKLIMVVEDEPLLLQAVAKKLDVVGLSSVACSGGFEALDYLKTHPDTLPDLIWLDFKLKDMDGLGLMSKLKENESWAKIPVIVVSNSASENKVHNMLALGAKKYILKAEHRMDDIIQIARNFIDEN
jgi:CheY-like chemotaxis protein